MIIYTTSLGLVRKTQYECKYVKQIFHNLLVRFDEKDLFVHPNFKKELQRKLRTEILTLPQVFINGQSIGVILACLIIVSKSKNCIFKNGTNHFRMLCQLMQVAYCKPL